jgi:ribosome-associated translation inhibitor RaiA
LLSAVKTEAAAYAAQFTDVNATFQVRLFDVNAARGGIDKGCLVSVRLGRGRKIIVASELDSDLYRAIPAAFNKLSRATRAAITREHTLRRTSRFQPNQSHSEHSWTSQRSF